MNAKINLLAITLILTTGCTFLESTAGKTMLDYVIQALLLILTPLFLLLAKRLIVIVEQRTGITLAEQHARLVDDAIYKGIAYAEEQSRKALKLQSVPVPGDTKKDIALEFVINTLKANKVAEYGSDYLSKAIEAQLNLSRLNTGK